MDEEGVEGESLLHPEDPAPSGDGLGQRVLLGPEHGARLADHRHPLQVGAVGDRAHKVRELDRGK